MVNINFKINDNGVIINVCYDSSMTIRDFILDFTRKYTNLESIDPNIYTFKIGIKFINSPRFLFSKIGDLIRDGCIVNFVRKKSMSYSGGYWCNKSINIQFIKISKNCIYKKDNTEIIGLSKLCLLKEISQKIPEENLKKLPELIYCIMKILSKGYVDDYDVKNNIKEILLKAEGSSIINFSNFVEEMMDINQMYQILNLLSKEDLIVINDIKHCLSAYNKEIKLFNKEFEKDKKESYLEFSMISSVIRKRKI